MVCALRATVWAGSSGFALDRLDEEGARFGERWSLVHRCHSEQSSNCAESDGKSVFGYAYTDIRCTTT